MIPAAKTKTNELLRDLSTFKTRGIQNGFALKKYKAEAAKLMAISQPEAYTILGAIACLEGKDAEMREFHEKAIELSGGFVEWSNYLASLQKASLWEEAFSIALEGYHNNVHNIMVIKEAIDILQDTCRFVTAFELVQALNNLTPENKHKHSELFQQIQSLYNRYQINEDDVAKMMGDVSKIVARSKTFVEESQYFVIDDEIFIELKLADESIDVVGLQEQIDIAVINLITPQNVKKHIHIGIYDKDIDQLVECMEQDVAKLVMPDKEQLERIKRLVHCVGDD